MPFVLLNLGNPTDNVDHREVLCPQMDRAQRNHLIITETQEDAPCTGATYIINAQSKLLPLLLRLILILMAMLHLDSMANIG